MRSNGQLIPVYDIEVGDIVRTTFADGTCLTVENIERLQTRREPYRITWKDGKVTRHSADAQFRVIGRVVTEFRK